MPFRWAPREEQFPRPPELRIRVTVSCDRHTIYLAGELDVASAPELKAVLGGIVLDASEVVIDLDGLTFIDSTGLTCILECQESCRRSHTDFLLTPVVKTTKSSASAASPLGEIDDRARVATNPTTNVGYFLAISTESFV